MSAQRMRMRMRIPAPITRVPSIRMPQLKLKRLEVRTKPPLNCSNRRASTQSDYIRIGEQRSNKLGKPHYKLTYPSELCSVDPDDRGRFTFSTYGFRTYMWMCVSLKRVFIVFYTAFIYCLTLSLHCPAAARTRTRSRNSYVVLYNFNRYNVNRNTVEYVSIPMVSPFPVCFHPTVQLY